jgi:hypothetical protein
LCKNKKKNQKKREKRKRKRGEKKEGVLAAIFLVLLGYFYV